MSRWRRRLHYLYTRRGLIAAKQHLRRNVLHHLQTEPSEAAALAWHSSRRINSILGEIPKPTSYLEIGVSRGRTIENVFADVRIGVDPFPLFNTTEIPTTLRFYQMRSDDYFFIALGSEAFDVIFLDGLHEWQQTYRDLKGALSVLKPGGAILIDDTVPTDELSAIPNQAESLRLREKAGLQGRQWHGDVWRVVMAIEALHPELEWCTITEPGNGQTLVWRSSDLHQQVQQEVNLDWLQSRTYRDEFASGLPTFLRPTSELSALSRWAEYRRSVVGQ